MGALLCEHDGADGAHVFAENIHFANGFSRRAFCRDREHSLAAEEGRERKSVREIKHVYEVRPRTDHRGVDLIADALPFGRLW
jgi:hypothetical protein